MNASWVAIDLMEFAVRTEDAVQSPEAALEWLRSFRDTLLMEGRNSRPMPWAVELLGMADVKIAKKSIARMQGQIVKIYGKDCDVDLECSKKYGEKYEKLKKILAAAATREGVGVVHDRESGSLGRATTGCNNSQVAPHRKAGEFKSDSGNAGNLEPATACNLYDQETDQVSTDEALDKPGAGEVPPENVSKKPSPALPVPAKKAHGEFGNVMLTDDEYAKLCEKCADADALITELDQYIESQGKTKKYKSHYATMLNWSRRKAQEAKPQQRYKNINDINQENYEKAMREIEAMCAGEAV